jgi:eukaryotic-like serine/threonine-protein kinase
LRKGYGDRPVKKADSDRVVTESFAPPSITTSDVGPTVGELPVEMPPLVGPQVRSTARYHIMGEHGRGGLGRVSRAHDLELGRDVAIKELISRGRINEVRFLREALITARLEHPGIVPIHEAGRWSDGTPFYAMKLVSGRSLRDLIVECTTSDQRLGLLHHVIAVADAIAYAHRRNIIHRDLKPANVIVGDFGETVVIDWGLAKDLTAGDDISTGDPENPLPKSPDDELTSVGSVLGTPAYMAPEQARGEQVDQRADVFAIGTMLWELCAARRRPPKSPDARHRVLRRAGIDRDLAIIIDKALDPERERRYPDAGALAADLKAFKAGVRIAARSYSLWAMLTHWTRRHRVLALSVSAAVVLATTGVVVFVRNIAAARDRADAALVTAQQERDRAKLSEASLLVEADPTRARDLLTSLSVRSPLYALLTSRARPRSAARIVPSNAVIEAIYRAPGSATVEVRTRGGELSRLNPGTGSLEVMDHDLTGPIAYRDGQWLYTRKPPKGAALELSTQANPNAIPIGELTSATHLVSLHDAVYALDSNGVLYRLDGKSSSVVQREIHGIAGDGNLLMICRTSGDLEVLRDGAVVLRRRRCPEIKSSAPMAVANDDFAAITTDGMLTASRRGRQLDLRTDIVNDFEIALSNRGVIAIADYSGNGRTWFVRPDGNTLEPGPLHTSQPFSVAADGNLVAWGYVDGTVIALDAVTRSVWKLGRHPGQVTHVLIDADSARVISAGARELRIWDIKPPPSSFVHAMPCAIFHATPSPDATQIALDCSDGGVWAWSRPTGAVRKIHQHDGLAFGVQWVRGMICSGGWVDGRVLCTTPGTDHTRTLDSGTKRIMWLTATPDHNALIYASADGKLWRLDDEPRQLHTASGVPSRMAISDNGRLLAWWTIDGWFDVFDLGNRKLLAHLFGHGAPTSSVSWLGEELWTTGNDGTLRRWGLQDGRLRLRHSVSAPGSFRLIRVTRNGWAAVIGESQLLVSLDGTSIALRLDVGKHIDVMDTSATLRYVAVAANSEIVVVDTLHGAIATLAIGAPLAQQVRFLDETSLSFNEPGALKTLHVDRLDYVQFQPTPEPPNGATF